MRLEQLPLDNRTRQSMVRRLHQVVQTGRESHMRGANIVTNRFSGVVDLRFTPLAASGSTQGVIVMFEVGRSFPAADARNPVKQIANQAKPKNSIRSKKKSSRKK
jgi:hypothetical protein